MAEGLTLEAEMDNQVSQKGLRVQPQAAELRQRGTHSKVPSSATSEWHTITTALHKLFNSGVMSPSGNGNISTRLQNDCSRLLLKCRKCTRPPDCGRGGISSNAEGD